MNFHVLNMTTNKVISRSNFRLSGEPTSPNLRIEPLTAPAIITSSHLSSDYLKCNEESPAVTEEEPPNSSTSSPKHNVPNLDPNDLMRRHFLFNKKMVNACELE